MSELKIIVPKNFKGFGEKVNAHINKINGTDINYIIEPDLVRFNDGEGKAVINDSLRNKNVFILSDVTNYDVTYLSFGQEHHMSRDEHFMDILRILSAECGHAAKRTIITPYLYEGRQDKKVSRESLDGPMALQLLEFMGANEIITCDVHSRPIMGSVARIAFENVYLGDLTLLDLLQGEEINSDNIIFIAPDNGATGRANFYADLLGGAPTGIFSKRRDYATIDGGKNPIVDQRFNGPDDLSGQIAIVTDDMIASGGSILKTAKKLKELGAEKIYLAVTFGLFTMGIDEFSHYYDEGIIDRVYATNVSYVPDYIQEQDWFRSVDCSMRIAHLINEIYNGRSIGNIIEGNTTEAAIKIRELRMKHETR